MSDRIAERARVDRWRTGADLLAAIRRAPDASRADLARSLGLRSSTAAEVAARLREAGLVVETRAAATGRGRPTTVFDVHPEGPLVLAVEIRQPGWRVAVADLSGVPVEAAAGPHDVPESLLGTLRSTVDDLGARYGDRVRAVGLSVAGTVQDGRIGEAANLGWGAVDLTGLVSAAGPDLSVGNDATLAGVAEARDGAAVGAPTALHLVVDTGVGGALVLDGRPLGGARGAAGEYGHLPFGDPALACPCGATGCWDMETDGRALARHLGEPAPPVPHRYAREVLDRAAAGEEAARAAVAEVARALGRGIAGLVNAHDPDVVTVGGLVPALRAGAPDAFADAYAAGLMRFRRAAAPPVLDAVHAGDGPLRGAAAVALDRALSPEGLAAWADR